MHILRVAAVSCVAVVGSARADCLKGNAGIPPDANTTDASEPFYIDTSGLDFKTLPPTRDPTNPNYPQATELPDGTLPPSKAEGNFIIGPTHSPAPELTAQDGAPTGKIYSFTMSSNDSTVFSPGMIRDDPGGCLNASVYAGRRRPATSRTFWFQPPMRESGPGPSTSMFRRATSREAKLRSSSLATEVPTAFMTKNSSSRFSITS